MNNIYKIYKITNNLNNKHYIGKTKRSIFKRFKEHSSAESIIGRAIRKYGEDSFSVSILSSTDIESKSCELEAKFVEVYDSYNNGYNATPTGDIWYEIKRNYVIPSHALMSLLVDFGDANVTQATLILINSMNNTMYIKASHNMFVNKWSQLFELVGISLNSKRTQQKLKKFLITEDIVRFGHKGRFKVNSIYICKDIKI